MDWRPVELAGWGRTARARILSCRPRDATEATAALAEANGATILPYGGGRSYGDVALNGAGRALLTSGLNRILEFDAATGAVVCEAGVTFRDLMEAYLPRRYLVPVSPGTAFATIGGAVANDVHGKNHEVAGSFGDHVVWLDLALPSGEVRRVCPRTDSELLAATIGGIGLTGLILRVCFRLQAVPSASVAVEERRIGDLDGFMAAFAQCRTTSTFSVGWIDAMARGRQMGRGILETAEFAAVDVAPFRRARQRNVPFDFPSGVLNPFSIRLFNELYYRRVSTAGRRRTVPIQKFLYPLDALGHWNRIYGRRGFFQFQCVVPDRTAPAGITALLEAIARAPGLVPRGPEDAESGWARASVVPRARLHPGAGLPARGSRSGAPWRARADCPEARRARLSRQGRLTLGRRFSGDVSAPSQVPRRAGESRSGSPPRLGYGAAPLRPRLMPADPARDRSATFSSRARPAGSP